VATNASVPAAKSKPPTQRSPSTSLAGSSPTPSSGTAITGTRPRSSIETISRSLSQTGARPPGNGSQFRSSFSVSTVTSPLVLSITATRVWR
jgi:hypothetical protein